MFVNEIFSSIQGESSWQGFPFTFVRLGRCNLRCSYCDTSYAYSEGTEMDRGEIVSRVVKFGFPRVIITGGEPLLQEETTELIEMLLREDFLVLLETNGSVPLANVHEKCVKIVDVKTPGSGAGGSFLEENLRYLDGKDEIKFVLTGREDYSFALDFIMNHLNSFPGTVLLSPVSPGMNPAELSQWILDEKLDCRINIQLHKYIFGMKERGV